MTYDLQVSAGVSPSDQFIAKLIISPNIVDGAKAKLPGSKKDRSGFFVSEIYRDDS